MFKNLLKSILIAFVLTASNPALASGYKNSIEQCLVAHQVDDKGKVLLIASEIASIKMYGDQTRIDAAKCMTYAYGGEWVYDHSAKAMINKNAVSERQKKRDKLYQLSNEKRILKNRIARINIDIDEQFNEKNKMDERLQNINLMLILKETHTSCSDLYLKNKEAAIINPTCVEAFKKLGHPLLDTYKDEPAIDQTDKEINRLIALKFNVQAQIDDIQKEINSTKKN